MRENAVSVIVPVYNVEKFLDRCVRSILQQSYDELEIILVDDGSTDGSGEICDSLAKTDKRIIVIHQKNQGLSAARNTGLEASHGEYICFVDSDDYVNRDYVKYLYKLCTENDCDVAICGHHVTSEQNYYRDINIDSPAEILSKEEIFDRFYTDMHGSIVLAWNKIYRRECIGDIRYEVGIIHEDEATTFKILYNANKIAFGREVCYYYFSRPDSITGRGYNEKSLDILKAYNNRMLFYKEHGETALYDRECQYYLSEILAHYFRVYYKIADNRTLLKSLRTKYKEVYSDSDRKKWSEGRRMLYFTCEKMPLLYGRIKKFK